MPSHCSWRWIITSIRTYIIRTSDPNGLRHASLALGDPPVGRVGSVDVYGPAPARDCAVSGSLAWPGQGSARETNDRSAATCNPLHPPGDTVRDLRRREAFARSRPSAGAAHYNYRRSRHHDVATREAPSAVARTHR